VPRAGLTAPAVVDAAAAIVDEVGLPNLTMALLAQRLQVRTPSLYKHVDSLGDLHHRIAVLAMTQLADSVRDAIGGRSGRDALMAFGTAFREFVQRYPGRYAATVGRDAATPDDPLTSAGNRVLDAMRAVLRGYGIPAREMDHALRTLRSMFHGFVSLQGAAGFRMPTSPDASFHWMIDFADRGLSTPRTRR
jgi:AcrR family transcriptional regulator